MEKITIADAIADVSKTSTSDDNREKPRRPLSAYNFFLKEERQKILANEDSAVAAVRREKSRPMKKRKLVEPTLAKKAEEGESLSGINIERIGKLIGERWQEVKAKPELFTKYDKLASDDQKRYAEEMKEFNKRKKRTILSAMESESSSPEPGKVEVDRPSSVCSDRSGSVQITKVAKTRQLDISEKVEHEPRDDTSNKQSMTRTELERQLKNASPAALANLQSLLANRAHAVPSLSDYLNTPAQMPLTNAGLLAQVPLLRNVGLGPPVPAENAVNLALLRQQEEQLALLRHRPNPTIESLYREYMQVEQAKALLAGTQGLQGLQGVPQHAQLSSSAFAPGLETLLSQQSASVPLALQQLPQQAQLALLSSQMSAAQRNGLEREISLPQVPSSHGQPPTQVSQEDAASILLAYSDMLRKRG